MNDNSFTDYLAKVNIQEVLKVAGYHLNRKDGIRYPSYVRLDASGAKVSGDKFLVTRNGQCCFRPNEDKRYNVISFITSFPQMFPQYQPGMNQYYLVHQVCKNILGEPMETRAASIVDVRKEREPFSLDAYDIKYFDIRNKESYKPFYPYFVTRGINLSTQCRFRPYFMLATKEYAEDRKVTNLAFPMRIPGDMDKIVGLEERGRRRSDGTSYKGMASGTNSSEGLWIASPTSQDLSKTRNVFWFESAYDAMSYFQLHMKDLDARYGVYVSTGGNPSVGQMRGVLDNAPDARHHLCFDDDAAGRQFVENFRTVAGAERPSGTMQERQVPSADPLIRPELIPYLESVAAPSAADRLRNIFTSRGRKREFERVLSGRRDLLPEEFRQMDQDELREALVDYDDIYSGIRGFMASVPEDRRDLSDMEALLAAGDVAQLPSPVFEIYEEAQGHAQTKEKSQLEDGDQAADREIREDSLYQKSLQHIGDIISAWTAQPFRQENAVDIVREVPGGGYKDWNDLLLSQVDKARQLDSARGREMPAAQDVQAEQEVSRDDEPVRSAGIRR